MLGGQHHIMLRIGQFQSCGNLCEVMLTHGKLWEVMGAYADSWEVMGSYGKLC